MADIVKVSYRGESARQDAEYLRDELVSSGMLEAASSVEERPDIPGKLGLGEIVLIVVVTQAAKVAIDMVFDELEKVLKKAMEARQAKASLRVEVRSGDEEGQSQVVVVRRDIVIDKAITLAMKTVREIVKSLIK